MDINKITLLVPISVMAELPAVIGKFEINTPYRLTHFVAQSCHESLNFTRVKENCKYTTLEQLVKIFHHDFDKNHDKVISPEELAYAKSLLGDPIKIANFVYANQNGNGNEASGDGFKHRGFGYLMITGKENQEKFFKSIGLPADTNPELIATKYPLQASAWFWNNKKLNQLADKGVNNSVIGEITHIVNGGLIGLDERIKLVNKFYPLLQ